VHLQFSRDWVRTTSTSSSRTSSTGTSTTLSGQVKVAPRPPYGLARSGVTGSSQVTGTRLR
jgi:hypothetical protein